MVAPNWECTSQEINEDLRVMYSDYEISREKRKNEPGEKERGKILYDSATVWVLSIVRGHINDIIVK